MPVIIGGWSAASAKGDAHDPALRDAVFQFDAVALAQPRLGLLDTKIEAYVDELCE